MSERNLVASALKSRKAWEVLAPLLEPEELSEQGRMVWEHIGAYYERDPETKGCDPELIANSVERSLTNAKHRTAFRALVEGLAGAEISPENAVADHVAFKLGNAGNRLASALAAGKQPNDIGPLLEEYQKWSEATPDGPAREVF